MKYLTLLVTLLLTGPSTFCAADPPPNIVLILLDDLGYGDLGCYNAASKIKTPHIDRLAREGMRFTDAHSAGVVCHPARYGLLTGRYPFRTDVSKWPTQPLIREGQATVATLLAARGYRTAMVGKWHLGFEEKGYDQALSGGPVDRGFQSFFGFRASTDIPPYFFIKQDRALAPPTESIEENHSEGWSPIQGAFWRTGKIAPGLKLEEVLPRLTEEAIKEIKAERRADQPLFLYWALTAPHTPWLPSEEFRDKSGAGMYGDFTMMVDAMVGRVLAALDDQKLENTIVILTSDNGPTWYPEDVERTGHDSAGAYRGMKGLHWEAGHRVPFIVRWPGKVKAGATSAQLVGFTDVAATLAEISGATLGEEDAPDSFSFARVLTGERREDQPIRASLVVGNSIRMGDWKYIEGRENLFFGRANSGKEPPAGAPAGQLFDLRNDLGETTNLASARVEVATELQRELKRIREAARTRP